ncbi:hypothetical protein [Boudabousia marimammalium]|uniref:Uncharacterized protein n=1 Tax=Boudabousia marimammalium TaxID=156892 RepID=A0A1Q5PNZ7_9ACTO|nr:hypothetical protein [Boudabousia marimammalium]OKL49232.1 hypothetical protein BM477_04375 [Boudabousia marimammalium]
MTRDFDEEFDKIMSGTDAGTELTGQSADLESEIPYEIPPADLQIEEVRPAEDGKRSVGLVLTELLHYEVLQKIVELEKLPGRALGTETGAVLWVPVSLEGDEEDEFAALLGDARPVADELARVAQRIAEVIGRNVIVAQSWLRVDDEDDEVSVAGQIVAWRVTKAGTVEPLHGGLVVSSMAEDVEDLLVGRTDPLTHNNYEPSQSAWPTLQAIKQAWFNRGKKD